MPKHSKHDSSSDSDSGPDDAAPPPSKKTKSGNTAKKNDSGETYFDIEGLKRITVRDFKGRIYVDIREFYEKDGKVLPGKKGISLSGSQWGRIKSLVDDVDSVLEQLR